MASKLIARRKPQPKKASTLVSKQTLEVALQEAEALVAKLMESGSQDENLEKLQDSISFLTSILKKAPVEMQQEGAASIEDYLDDAIMPEMAEKIKKDVDFIASLKGGDAQPDSMGNLPDDRTVEMNTRANETIQDRPAPRAASGSDNWVTDRNEDGEPKEASGSDNWVSDRADGEPKEPVLAEVPRLATKITAELFYGKKAAPVAVPAKAAPAVNPDADIQQLSSDVLAKMLKALSTAEDLMNDKAANKFIGAIAAELAKRPVEQEAPAPVAAAPAAPAAAPMPLAASFAGLNLAGFEDDGEEDKTAGFDRRRDLFKEDMKRKQEAEKEEAEKDENVGFVARGHKPKEASNQGGSFVNDGDTGTVVEDGGRTPEIAAAHKELEDNTGITRPATELPSKFAALTDSLPQEELKRFLDWLVSYVQGKAPAEPQYVDMLNELLEETKAAVGGGFNPTASSKFAEDMSTGAAIKKVEKAADDLKALYLETKKVTKTLDSRPVRESIEAIYRAYDLMGEAAKVLNKQKMQEDAEEKATEIKDKNKKSSLLFGLVLAEAEEDDK